MKSLMFLKKIVAQFLILTIVFIVKANAQHYRLVLDSNYCDYDYSVVTTKDKGILMQYFNSAIGWSVVTKFDSLLNVTWNKKDLIGADANNPPIQDSSGNYFVSGMDVYDMYGDLVDFIDKLDSAGNIVRSAHTFEPTFGGSSCELYDYKFDKINNRILVVCYDNEYDPDSGLFWSETTDLIVMDLNFNVLWIKGDSANINYKIFPVYLNNDVNYIFTDGNTFTKLDTSGNILWGKNFSASNGIRNVLQSDSNYFLVSSSNMFSSILKTDLNGNVINSVSSNPSDSLIINSINSFQNGTLIAVGTLSNDKKSFIMQLDDSLNVIQSLVDTGMFDGRLCFVDSGYNIITAGNTEVLMSCVKKPVIDKTNFNGSCGYIPVSINMLPDSIYSTSLPNPVFSISNPFSTSVFNYTLNNFNTHPYLECGSLEVQTAYKNNDFEIFPNPVSPNSSITISSISYDNMQNVEITNSLGVNVLNQNIKSVNSKIKLFIPNIPRGIYFLKISSSHGVVVKKLVVD
jgi:hypothetical protein